jgi:hypothetical protein
MVKQELEFFFHGQGAKPRSVFAAPTDTLRDALVRSGIINDGEGKILVFVGECREALVEADEVEDGADAQAPVDTSLTVEVLEIARHRHVHCHPCRHVAAEFVFNGRTKRRKFSPSTTIEVATQWARKKFHLDPAAAAEYVLELCGTTDKPRPDKHLGELVKPGTCSICFDLVKEVTPQG